MATAAELFASLNTEEPHIIINSDRSVTIPEELKNVAVQYDHNIETVTFDCPRYWDGNDLSEMIININFVRPDKYEDTYVCKNVTVDSDDPNIMHFDWTISRSVTEVSGTLTFIVCARKSYIDGETSQVWHSQKCDKCTILPGLKCDQAVIPSEPEYNGVQVDYNQNDETAGDYIKNRPFYKESKVYDSFPDANYSTPAYNYPDQGLILYRISNTPIEDTNFDGAVVTYHKSSAPTEKNTITLTSADYDIEEGLMAYIAVHFYIFYNQFTNPDDETVTIEPGIYSMPDGEGNVYCLDSIEFISKVVKVPSMFLPDKDYYNMTESDDLYLKKADYSELSKLYLYFKGQRDLTGLFAHSRSKSIPVVNTSDAFTVESFCWDCQYITRVGGVGDGEGFNFINIQEGGLLNAFKGCYSLVYVNIMQESVTQDINFQDCYKLNDNSIQNIIDALATVDTKRTLRFPPPIIAKLTEDQLTTIRNKNWILG